MSNEIIIIDATNNGNTPIVFEAKENVKAISLSLLSNTQSLSEYDGKLPKTRPVEHFQLINDVCENIQAFGFTPVIDPIFVSSSDSKRIKALDVDQTSAAKSWLFQRLVTRVNIKELSDEISNTSIGIGYNTSGINIAWGANVHVCQNMSILGGQNYMSNYGSGKEPSLQAIFERFREWLRNANDRRAFDVEMIRKMQSTFVNATKAVPEFIGNLHMAAVRKAYVDVSQPAPLNIGQMSDYSKEFLKLDSAIKQKEEVDLFTLFNIGTAILKPMKSDLTDLWKNNAEYGDFFLRSFALK
jgi:hypothetical protein